MNKKEKAKVVLHSKPLPSELFDGTFAEIITKLYSLQERMKQEHSNADGFYVDPCASYDGIDPEVVAWRWETDEEYEQRQERNRRARERQRERQRELREQKKKQAQTEEEKERALYEKLKAKFENA